MYSITLTTETLDNSTLTYGRCFIYRNGLLVAQAVGASPAHAKRRAHADVRRSRKAGWMLLHRG